MTLNCEKFDVDETRFEIWYRKYVVPFTMARSKCPSLSSAVLCKLFWRPGPQSPNLQTEGGSTCKSCKGPSSFKILYSILCHLLTITKKEYSSPEKHVIKTTLYWAHSKCQALFLISLNPCYTHKSRHFLSFTYRALAIFYPSNPVRGGRQEVKSRSNSKASCSKPHFKSQCPK